MAAIPSLKTFGREPARYTDMNRHVNDVLRAVIGRTGNYPNTTPGNPVEFEAAIVPASHTNSQRPASPPNGAIIYNSSEKRHEFRANGMWMSFDTLIEMLQFTDIAGLPGGTTNVYDSSGTWSKPNAARWILVELWGGGGGGGRGSSSSGPGAWGGSGGDYTRKLFKASDLPDRVTYTVGSGGRAVTGTSASEQVGADGGDTRFQTMTAKGGDGGAGSAGNPNVAGNVAEYQESVGGRYIESGGVCKVSRSQETKHYAGGAGGFSFSSLPRPGGKSVEGGNGGDGATGPNSVAGSGSVPGGGGGGVFSGPATRSTSGSGAGGRVRITWI